MQKWSPVGENVTHQEAFSREDMPEVPRHVMQSCGVWLVAKLWPSVFLWEHIVSGACQCRLCLLAVLHPSRVVVTHSY